MKRTAILIAALLVAAAQAAEKPNIVVVADDLGYGRRSVGDLRGAKPDLWEEGRRVPFLSRRPGTIPAGAVSDETMCHVDFLATIPGVLGTKLTDDAGEDGVDILPALSGEKTSASLREPTVHRSADGDSAIRPEDRVLSDAPTGDDDRAADGPARLKEKRGDTAHDQPGEIDDLWEDPARRRDRDGEKPQLVKEMKARLEKYRREGRSTPGAPQKNDSELGAGPPAKDANAPRAPEPAEAEAEAARELMARAESGDAAAQLALAVRLRDGKGVNKNDVAALGWAHRAADAGNADAMDFVGLAYLRGNVAERNAVVAFGYFKAAAERSANAAFNLGQCFYGAQGTEQDCEQALAWWEKAAERGHGRAAAAAAMAYLAGEGVGRDAAKARRLAERAAELGNASGLVVLGEMQFQAGEIEAAKANWTKASRLHPVHATGHPAQPSDHASAQQGADLLKLLQYRQRKSEPGKFAFVPMQHIHQGYNNCGSTACATFARFQGSRIGGWDFKKLCPSPLGTGTDWWHLLAASKKIGQKWKLVAFTPDDAGFQDAAAFLKKELDAGRPVVVDFKYVGPQYPGGFAGHTLSVCGYLSDEDLYILCNPAVATPGLQLVTAAELKNFWRSDYYGAQAKGVLSRPAFVIEQP